jgi:CubicO group peptidase (beta-lactamase class C family)
MEDFRVEDGEYFRGADSIHPAYPLRMSARDLARFGLLYARGGRWKGRQLVPAAWVKESLSPWSDAGRSGGYGYMWWVAANGRHLPGAALPDGSFSARGAGGHYVLAVPALDVVIVHRADTDAWKPVSDAQFGALVNLILEAKVR